MRDDPSRCTTPQDPLLDLVGHDISQRAPLVKSDEPHNLPFGFSPAYNTELAWTGTQYGDAADYVFQLTSNDLAEIDSALATFKGKQARYYIATNKCADVGVKKALKSMATV